MVNKEFGKQAVWTCFFCQSAQEVSLSKHCTICRSACGSAGSLPPNRPERDFNQLPFGPFPLYPSDLRKTFGWECGILVAATVAEEGHGCGISP